MVMQKRDPDEARRSDIDGLNFTGPCLLLDAEAIVRDELGEINAGL